MLSHFANQFARSITWLFMTQIVGQTTIQFQTLLGHGWMQASDCHFQPAVSFPQSIQQVEKDILISSCINLGAGTVVQRTKSLCLDSRITLKQFVWFVLKLDGKATSNLLRHILMKVTILWCVSYFLKQQQQSLQGTFF